MSSRPRLLKNFLNSNRRLKGLLQQGREQGRLLDRVSELIPPQLRPHLVNARLERNQLYLSADSSAWASRLRYTTRTLRAAFPEVRDVRVRVSPPASLPPSIPKPRREMQKLSAESAEQMQQIARAVKDPALSRALLRLAQHV